MSAGRYNLRSRPTDPALPENLDNSPEQFPPLPSSSPNMTSPSSNSRDDMLMNKLNALTDVVTAIAAQHQERNEAQAAADDRMARLEELVATLTTSRSVDQVSIPTPPTTSARTPQLNYIPPVRRQLLPVVPETATSAAPLLPACPVIEFPEQAPELVRKEVEKYEMKSVMKLMATKKLKHLKYDDWLQFYRDLTSALNGCNAPDEYSRLFSLYAPANYVPDKLANRRAYYTLTDLCAKGEVLAVVQAYELAQDGRAAFLKLQDACNTQTMVSADTIRYQIMHFSFTDSKAPNVQIQRLKELHEQLALAQQDEHLDLKHWKQSLVARLQDCALYKTKMLEFQHLLNAGYSFTEQDILSATDLIYTEKIRPTSSTVSKGNTPRAKVNALQHKPKQSPAEQSSKKGKGPAHAKGKPAQSKSSECSICKAFGGKSGQNHALSACPPLASKLGKNEDPKKAASVTLADPEQAQPSTSRAKVNYTRKVVSPSTDEQDYWQTVVTEPKLHACKLQVIRAASSTCMESSSPRSEGEDSSRRPPALPAQATPAAGAAFPGMQDSNDLVPAFGAESPNPTPGDGAPLRPDFDRYTRCCTVSCTCLMCLGAGFGRAPAPPVFRLPNMSSSAVLTLYRLRFLSARKIRVRASIRAR